MTAESPSAPRDLSASEYPRLVAVLTGDDAASSATWAVGDGSYAQLMRQMADCRYAWHAVSDERTLVVGDFGTPEAAAAAHDALHLHVDSWGGNVDGAVAFARGTDGELTVLHATHHRTARRAGWGVAAGALVGILFPPSVLVSAAVLGAGGAASGSRSERRARDRAQEEVGADLPRGMCRLVVVVSDPRRG